MSQMTTCQRLDTPSAAGPVLLPPLAAVPSARRDLRWHAGVRDRHLSVKNWQPAPGVPDSPDARGAEPGPLTFRFTAGGCPPGWRRGWRASAA